MADPRSIDRTFVTAVLGRADLATDDAPAHLDIRGITGRKPIHARQGHAAECFGVRRTNRVIRFDDPHVARLRAGLIVNNIVNAAKLAFAMQTAPVLSPMNLR